jgi:hypothetical protein
VTSTHVSFLFDASQTRRLLDAAAALPDNSRARQRGPAYRAICASGTGSDYAPARRAACAFAASTPTVAWSSCAAASSAEPPRPARARIAGLVEEQAGRRRACGTAAGPDSAPAGRAQRYVFHQADNLVIESALSRTLGR